MKRKITKSIILFLFVTMLCACNSEHFSGSSDYLQIVTKRIDEKEYDFSSAKTFFLSEKVYDTTSSHKVSISVYHEHDNEILLHLAENLNSRGFEETQELDEADLIVTAFRIAQTNWDYKGSYYHPEFEDTIVKLTGITDNMIYRTEGIIIMIVSTEVAESNDPVTLSPVWIAGIHNQYYNLVPKVIETAINQAFDDSPYLKAK